MRNERGDLMNTVTVWLGSAVCVILALTPTSQAQEKQAVPTKKPASYRMEIYNGPYRTVHYFSTAEASPAEREKVREAERTENAANLHDQVQGLLRQYLADEAILERRRHDVQYLYYGYSNVTNQWLMGGQALGTYPYAYDYSYPYYYGYYGPFYPYYGYGYAVSPGSITATNGLFGASDSGFIKAELAKALAAQVAPLPGK
jgi:hypothetical protein